MRLCSRICLILCSCRIRITKQLDVQSEQEEERETQRRPSRYKSKQIRKEQTESHKEELEEKVYSISISITIEDVGPFDGLQYQKNKEGLIGVITTGRTFDFTQAIQSCTCRCCLCTGQGLKFWCSICPNVYFLLQLSILAYHKDQWKLVGANLNSDLFGLIHS